MFHTKLRGAAQAPASLVAEIIVGGLADAIGLQVPARVFIDIAPTIPVDDPNGELARLLAASAGRNLVSKSSPTFLTSGRTIRRESHRNLGRRSSGWMAWS